VPVPALPPLIFNLAVFNAQWIVLWVNGLIGVLVITHNTSVAGPINTDNVVFLLMFKAMVRLAHALLKSNHAI